MTGYQSKKLMAQSREDDLVKRLRKYCDGNNDLMDAAADRIEQLEAAVRTGVYMRQRQKQYFKDRTQKNIVEAKQAEAAFDRVALREKKDAD